MQFVPNAKPQNSLFNYISGARVLTSDVCTILKECEEKKSKEKEDKEKRKLLRGQKKKGIDNKEESSAVKENAAAAQKQVDIIVSKIQALKYYTLYNHYL